MQFPKATVLSLAAGALLCAQQASHALVIEGDAADYEARVPYADPDLDGDQSAGQATSGVARVGLAGGTSSRLAASAVYFFALPARPDGQVVTGSNLSLWYIDPATDPPTPESNADLYGLGFDASPAPVQSADYAFVGALDTSSGVGVPTVMRVKDDFLTPTSPLGARYHTGDSAATTEAGDAALISFINSLYNAGAGEGDFAIFRVNYDALGENTDAHRYELATRNRGGATPTSSEFPLLDVEFGVVPEPSSAALMGIGGLFLARRRRR